MIRFPGLLLLVAFAAAGCSVHQGRPSSSVPAVVTDYAVVRDIVFTPSDWPQALQADVYVPEGKGSFPAVLLIHGGGWKAGDRKQVASLAKRIAERGYVVVNTTYRFTPGSRFPAQLQDVQRAVRWMHDNAAAYRIDPARIGAFGYSAGAHLAALLGGIGPGDALYLKDTQVRAVVGGGTPTNLAKPTDTDLVTQLLGGSAAQKPAEYRLASPVSYVTPGDAPVFLYHGGSDRLVRLDHAEDYKALLDQAGVPNELFILRGRGHITAFLTDGPAVDAALDFLDRYLR